MIELTQEEMIALNAIIDDEPIYGVFLIPEDRPEAERSADVEDSLEEKEFIIENELSDKGLITTRLLDDYKNSDTYIFINKLRLGYNKPTDVSLIEIIDTNENRKYHLFKQNNLTILKKIIEDIPFLRGAQAKTFFGFEPISMSEKEYEEELNDESNNWKNFLVIQKHVKGKLTQCFSLYVGEEKAYRYDYLKKERLQRGPRDLRLDLMELLEVGEVSQWQ